LKIKAGRKDSAVSEHKSGDVHLLSKPFNELYQYLCHHVLSIKSREFSTPFKFWGEQGGLRAYMAENDSSPFLALPTSNRLTTMEHYQEIYHYERSHDAVGENKSKRTNINLEETR